MKKLKISAIYSCLLLAYSSSIAELLTNDERAIIIACERLMADYAIYRDHLNADGFANTFTEDGVLMLGSGTSRGRSAIRENITSRPTPGVAHMIMLTSTKITLIDGHSATGISYGIVLNGDRPVDPGDPPIQMSGITSAVEYRTEFALTNDGWKISRLELRSIVRGPGIYRSTADQEL